MSELTKNQLIFICEVLAEECEKIKPFGNNLSNKERDEKIDMASIIISDCVKLIKRSR